MTKSPDTGEVKTIEQFLLDVIEDNQYVNGDTTYMTVEKLNAYHIELESIMQDYAIKAVRVELDLLLDEIDEMPTVDGHLIPYEEIVRSRATY